MDRLAALDPVVLVALLALEIAVARWGTREITGLVLGGFWRLIAYPILLPGTVLHELAHYTMARLLLIRVTKVELFHPRRLGDGYVELGRIEIEHRDPVRETLISLAPLLMVPPLLLLLTLGSLAGEVVQPWLTLILWVSIGLASLGAFPSTADRIPVLGLLALVAGTGAIGAVLYVVGGSSALNALLADAVLGLAVPAVFFGVLLVFDLLLFGFGSDPNQAGGNQQQTVIVFRDRPRNSPRPLWPRPKGARRAHSPRRRR